MQANTRVLVVDDGVALLNLLSSLLRSEGFNVVGSLASGHGVLTQIAKSAPHIVCLDYHLPDTDGITLLKQIQQSHPTVAVVMITGSNDPNLQAQATEAGAAGFITKPFSQQQIVQELQHVAHAQRLMQGKLAPAPDTSPVLGKKVVIADDSQVMRNLLQHILTECGMRVVGAASNGQQAITLTEQHQPDLVCLDVEMPVKNGLDALFTIHQCWPGIPVMMITARTDKKSVQIAAGNGARGYILKPYQPDIVVKAMHQLFDKLRKASGK